MASGPSGVLNTARSFRGLQSPQTQFLPVRPQQTGRTDGTNMTGSQRNQDCVLLTGQMRHETLWKCRDLSSLGREGNGPPLQYSCLENPMDGGAWKAAVHGVAEGRTRLGDFTFTFMHWRRKWQPTPVFLPGESIPGTGEPDGLPSMGSHRVGHD